MFAIQRNILNSHRQKYGQVIRSFSCHVERAEHAVALQLDYYMSPQFAGIACAMTQNLYAAHGVDVFFLPICPVGLEAQRVRDNTNKTFGGDDGVVTIGSVEQNIFIPALHAQPDLKLKGVAAMFRRSPLCLASLPQKDDDGQKIVVGAHEDTVSLLKRIFPSSTHDVIASPRATKITDLTSGKVGAIQAYTITEVPTLEHHLGTKPDVEILEGLNGTALGYSQLLFTSEEALACANGKKATAAFLQATFEGWDMAIRDPEMAAESVEEVADMYGLDDEDNDHWVEDNDSYQEQFVVNCGELVKETLVGDRLGVIEPDRFNGATEWLLSEEPNGDVGPDFGLDTSVWKS